MNILITGGAGFIGSNLIRHLLSSQPDLRIVNLDALTYAGNLANLSDVESSERYQFVKGDIADPTSVERCFTSPIQAIVNLAAESHVDRSIEDAAEFIRTNVLGTQILLDAARRHKVGRFLQVSTDEVYGSLAAEGSFTESSALAPNSPYAASKAAADLLVRAYRKTYGLDTIITRCSNNYGPFQFPEKLIPLIILNAIDGKPLPVYGDGLHRRDWIHVLDHCRALEVALLQGKAGETYNIGAAQEQENLAVVRRILEILGKSEELIAFVGDRPGHDRRYAIAADYIRTELDWAPRVPFQKGLAQTVRWYQAHSEWVAAVRSGEYSSYYNRMYENREETLSSLRGDPTR